MALEAQDLPHYTYDDYVQWEGRWEVIHGIPYAMSPQPNLRHQRISGNIHLQLERALEGCSACTPFLPVDWKIADDTIVQPDNLVVCADVSGAYLSVPPVLVFEILSPSTASKDRNLKFRLYQQQGVRFYVVVDPAEEQAVVYELEDGGYRRVRALHAEPFPFDLGSCEISFDFSRLWR